MIKKLMSKLSHSNTNQPRQNLNNTLKTTKYMLKQLWGGGRKLLFAKSLMSLVNAIFPLSWVLMPGLIINELTMEQRVNIIVIYVGITAGMPLIQKFISSNLGIYIQKLQYGYLLELQTDFISHCADMDYEFMEIPEIQITKERVANSLWESLSTFEYLSNIASAVISLIMYTSIITILNPLILFLLIIIVLINYFNNKWMNQKSFLINKEVSKYNRYNWPILNYFSSPSYAKEIRLFGMKDYFIKMYKDKKTEENKLGIKAAAYFRTGGLIGAAVSLIQTAALNAYLVYQVIRNGLSVGAMTIYMSAIEQFVSSLNSLTQQYTNLARQSLFVQEYMNFMHLPLRSHNIGSKIPVFDSNSIIEFKNVSFKYPGSENYALKNINITIIGDEKLCIVGANGSGKSTFIKLLTRLYMPTEGEISLNGININEYDYSKYFRIFSPVFQDFSLFNISLGENIIMAEDFNFEHLTAIGNQSGLSLLIDKNEKGYDTVIHKWHDEDAIEPSGGEGQKIAIARAVYRNSPLYLLDEPTAALDPIAEYNIYANFNDITYGKSVIYITHRLSAVQMADKIAVFEDGSLLEYGTHNELYNKNGLYAEMFTKQGEFFIKNQNA